jgi:hypothetical protein
MTCLNRYLHQDLTLVINHPYGAILDSLEEVGHASLAQSRRDVDALRTHCLGHLIRRSGLSAE